MPIEFTQYPPQENTGVSDDTLFRLTVAYDGTGRRISKTRWVKARGDAGWQRRHVTHYTGIGTEVRENFTGKSMQGECSENALVYFHCRAAGDCALRNELDDETQLNYFGARFYDPFLGLWMSPDPAGQFANPYTFGSDPVNYVDPNGEWVHIVIGAAIGATLGTINAIVQCTAPGGGGGNCMKAYLVQSHVGGAVGAAAAATGGAVGGGLAGGILGGAVGGAGGYAGNYLSYELLGMDAEWDKYEFLGSIVKGALSGAAGSVGSQFVGGATGALMGGFAAGATGSALNGEKDWDILKGGLMGAGMGLISYSATWAYENYSGDVIDQLSGLNGDYVAEPLNPEGSFVADEHLQEAHRILTETRNSLIANGENPMEYEVGASFRIRRSFWTGREFVAPSGEIGVAHMNSDAHGVGFESRTGDNFRMHLHPGEMTLGDGIRTNPYHPSGADYANAPTYKNYGISSYAGAVKDGQVNLYRYTYDNGTAKYWVAKW